MPGSPMNSIVSHDSSPFENQFLKWECQRRPRRTLLDPSISERVEDILPLMSAVEGSRSE